MIIQLPNNLIGRDYIKAREIVSFLLDNGLHTIEEKEIDKIALQDLYNEENKNIKKAIFYTDKTYLDKIYIEF